MFTVIAHYSLWFTPLCILVGAGVSYFLYRKDEKLKDAPLLVRRMLAVVRALVVSILCFLLLSPFIESTKETIQKPVVLVAIDNSESLLLNKDSAIITSELQQKIAALNKQIGEQFEVKSFSFSESLSDSLPYDFRGKSSNYTRVFEQLKNRYYNRNVGAVVFVSDGIYTQGNSSFYAYERYSLNAPVYSLALGDTLRAKDVFIADLLTNDVAYIGTKFPVDLTIAAHHLRGKQCELRIYHSDSIVLREPVNIDADMFQYRNTYYLEPKQLGAQQYKVELTSIDGELTINNNIKPFVVDVQKSKKQVLLVYNAPHPDIGAVKHAIKGNVNFEITTSSANTFKGKVKDYNLVILHQLPSKKNSINNILLSVQEAGIPVLYMYGQETDVAKISDFTDDFAIEFSKKSFDEVQPAFNQNFNLFTMSDLQSEFFSELPPLFAPYGNYSFSKNGQVLAFQKVGKVSTDRPLFYFVEKDNVRNGYIAGEGIWRWRILNYRKYRNTTLFSDFVNKIVIYLALKEKKEQFKVKSAAVFAENEDVVFEAEVYNDSYELTNDGEVTMVIKDSLKKEYPFTFSKTRNAYRLNAGNLPVGTFTYSATTQLGDKQFSKNGFFNVLPVNVEAENTLAKHGDLYKLSVASGGELFYLNETDKLAEAILKNNAIVSVSHFTKQLMELIQFYWLLVILLVLLSAEWFFRKYYASY